MLVGIVGVLVKVLGEAAMGLTASILRPSAEETTTNLWTVPAGTTILWPTLGTSLTLLLVWQGMELGLAARVMVPDSLISAMATVSGSDLTGDMLGEGERDSEPHRRTARLLGEVEPLAVPEDRGESGFGESGLPEPLVLLRGAGRLWRSGEFLIWSL